MVKAADTTIREPKVTEQVPEDPRASMRDHELELRMRLIAVQQALKVPKGQTNSFGGYKYRSCEDILEALKPHLAEKELLLTLSDTIMIIGERYYCQAQVSLRYKTVCINVYGYAREEETKKGMDGSQITGTSSSYARKIGVNGMFLIDDTKDSDTTNKGDQDDQQPGKKKVAAPAKTAPASNSGAKELSAYHQKLKGLILEQINQEGKTAVEIATEAKDMLEVLTTWTSKDGVVHPGKRDLITVSDLAAQTTYGKYMTQITKERKEKAPETVDLFDVRASDEEMNDEMAAMQITVNPEDLI